MAQYVAHMLYSGEIGSHSVDFYLSVGLRVKKTTISSPDFGLSVPPIKKYGKKEVIRYHDRFLVYAHMTKKTHNTKTLERRLVTMSAKTFRIENTYLTEGVTA